MGLRCGDTRCGGYRRQFPAEFLFYGCRDNGAFFFFFNDPPPPKSSTLPLPDPLPIFENPMPAALAGADALLAAARRAAVPLMVNWPTAWRAALRHGLALASAGEVGEPVQLSHRGGH